MFSIYQKSKIYKICSTKTESVYIGSTYQTLKSRFSGHKSTHKSGKKKITSSIIFNYGVEYAYIELLEEYPCNSRDELLKREGELMRTMKNCINKENPYDNYLDKRIELKNSEEYKANIKIKEDKKHQKLLKIENKKREIENKKKEIEDKKREIELEKEKNRVIPKNLDVELEKENIAQGIVPFNTSKDGNPMVVRENMRAYYEYINKKFDTFSTLLYKEYKIIEAEKEAGSVAKGEQLVEIEINKRKKTKKQREREIEKQIEKENKNFKDFCNTKEFKYHMLYIEYLEYIKKANGREWLEKIYKDKYTLETYKV